MLHAGEIRLRRIREEMVSGRRNAIELAHQVVLVQPHFGQDDRNVGRRRATRAGELANAVHRIVVVEGKQEPSAGREGIRLADQFQCLTGIGGKDHGPLAGIGVEELQHPLPGTGDIGRGARRTGVHRVRVAEQMVAEEREMAIELRPAVQTRGRIVQIRAPGVVQQRVFAGTQRVERPRGFVRGVSALEDGRGSSGAHSIHPNIDPWRRL